MSDHWPLYTIFLMIGLFVLVIGIDVILALNKRKGDTYSEVFTWLGRKWTPVIIMISFGMGLLTGHWFW